MRQPRIIISGLSGGSGKTMVSLGLARAFASLGLRVKTFKKGPDYIDAAWLALAAGTTQGNLDPFFSTPIELQNLLHQGAAGYSLTLIEGNRGLFDGLDIAGTCSTAELARILATPVILVVDCTKMTRTVAAIVAGCNSFEQNLSISGVILNRTGNPRHAALAKQAVEELAKVPVLGTLPRKRLPFIAERHMGLTGTDEHARAEELLDSLAAFVAEHVDITAIQRLASSAVDLVDTASKIPMSSSGALPTHISLDSVARSTQRAPQPKKSATPRIGYVRDAALWFYYQENLDALRTAGAELVKLSLLSSAPWPALDGLYLGGGVPELHAAALAANHERREAVCKLSLSGLPIYAECGGFMYLAHELALADGNFSMTGVFPVRIEWCSRPQGLGYTEVEAVAATPYHPVGSRFRGHEFHFSRAVPLRDTLSHSHAPPPLAHPLRLQKGSGMGFHEGLAVDGLVSHNTFACYTHIYAPAVPHWAVNFVELCRNTTRGSAP